MFRLNEFVIQVTKNEVLAFNESVTLHFKTIDEAISTLV